MNELTPAYLERRQELTRYFDRTAAAAWERLTSDAPVGRIRATVRAGRDSMRETLLHWLPGDLAGKTILDAGCGTGALSVAAADRGATVTGVDVSPTLLEVARERTPEALRGAVDYQAGDMLDRSRGRFDYVVAMDSLIHYKADDMVNALAALADIAEHGVIMTFAPRTPLLSVMHVMGRLLPTREHRAPAIEPVSEGRLKSGIDAHAALQDWTVGRTHRVKTRFYISQGLELIRE